MTKTKETNEISGLTLIEFQSIDRIEAELALDRFICFYQSLFLQNEHLQEIDFQNPEPALQVFSRIESAWLRKDKNRDYRIRCDIEYIGKDYFQHYTTSGRVIRYFPEEERLVFFCEKKRSQYFAAEILRNLVMQQAINIRIWFSESRY